MVKKIIILLLLSLFCIVGYEQGITPVADMRIANSTTHFGINVPQGFTIYDLTAKKLYCCDIETDSTKTLTTASANFTLIGGSGSGTLISIYEGYGVLLSPNPLTTTGIVSVDSSGVYSPASKPWVKTYVANRFSLLGHTHSISNILHLQDSLSRHTDTLKIHNIRINNLVDTAKIHLDSLKSHNLRLLAILDSLRRHTDTLQSHNNQLKNQYDSIQKRYTKNQVDDKLIHKRDLADHDSLTRQKDVDTTGIVTGMVLSWNGMGGWIMRTVGSGSGTGQNNIGLNVGTYGTNTYAGKTDTTLLFYRMRGMNPLQTYLNLTDKDVEFSILSDTLTDWWTKQNKGVVAYNWGQWHDTAYTRIYQGTGTLVTGSAPNYYIKADTGLVETKILATSQLLTKQNVSDTNTKDATRYWVGLQGFLKTFSESDPYSFHKSDSNTYKNAITPSYFGSHYKLSDGTSNGQLPYWDAGQGMWIPSTHISWNDTSDILTTKNIYAGGTITANTNLVFNSLNNYLTHSVSDTIVVDSLGYIKRRVGSFSHWNTAYSWGQWHDNQNITYSNGKLSIVNGTAPLLPLASPTDTARGMIKGGNNLGSTYFWNATGNYSVPPGASYSADGTTLKLTGTTFSNITKDSTHIKAGTGIHIDSTGKTYTITNTAPSSGGTVTSVTGTSPIMVSNGSTTPLVYYHADSLAALARRKDTTTILESKNLAVSQLATKWSKGDTTATLETKVYNNSKLALKVPTSRTISTTSPLAGGGDLTGNRTLYINTDTLASLARRKDTTTILESKNLATSQLATKVSTTRTISTTSPLMGGGDLTSNRTFYYNTDSLAALARRKDTANLLLSRTRAGHDYQPKFTVQNVTANSNKISLGGTPTGASIQPFSIDVNQGNIDHNSLLNYDAKKHFYQKAIDTVDNTKTGILTATSGVLGTITDNSSNWNIAYDSIMLRYNGTKLEPKNPAYRTAWIGSLSTTYQLGTLYDFGVGQNAWLYGSGSALIWGDGSIGSWREFSTGGDLAVQKRLTNGTWYDIFRLTGNEGSQTIDFTVNSVNCRLITPSSYSPTGDPCKLAMYLHSNGGDYTQFPNQTWKDTLLMNGYALLTASGTSGWGNETYQKAYEIAYNYTVKNYNVQKNVHLIAQSMGVLGMLNLLTKKSLPVTNCVSIVGEISLDTAYKVLEGGSPVFASGIEGAYNFTGSGQYANATQGYDPFFRIKVSVGDSTYNEIPPIIFLHGTADQYAPYPIAWKFYRVLKNHGYNASFIIAPGETHTSAISTPARVHTMFRFMDGDTVVRVSYTKNIIAPNGFAPLADTSLFHVNGAKIEPKATAFRTAYFGSLSTTYQIGTPYDLGVGQNIWMYGSGGSMIIGDGSIGSWKQAIQAGDYIFDKRLPDGNWYDILRLNANHIEIYGKVKIDTIPHSLSDTLMVDSAGVQKKRLKSTLGLQPTMSPGYRIGISGVTINNLNYHNTIDSVKDNLPNGTPGTDSLLSKTGKGLLGKIAESALTDKYWYYSAGDGMIFNSPYSLHQGEVVGLPDSLLNKYTKAQADAKFIAKATIRSLMLIQADTSMFSDSTFGRIYSDGIVIDTLIITAHSAGTLSVKLAVYYGTNWNTGSGATAVVTAFNTITADGVKTSVYTFNNATISNGNYVWVKIKGTGLKCKFFSVQVKGHLI